MLATLNRSAVIVTPKQPFLDWLHRADPTSLTLTLEDVGEPTIYLLPQCEGDQDLIAHVKNYCYTIFEDQLDGWYREQATWPPDSEAGPVSRSPGSLSSIGPIGETIEDPTNRMI